MDQAQIEARLIFAEQAAKEAGQLALGYFCTRITVEMKADATPVTVADRQAEQHLRGLLAQHWPDDAILGEEFGVSGGTTGFRWILDPIDGTKSFISGVPLWGTLIGVEYAGRSLAGVIYLPALDELVLGGVGLGAWHQVGSGPREPARVSTTSTLSECLFLTSEIKTYREAGRIVAYERLEQASRVARTWGDCYGYLLVATGRADVMVDPRMSVWDCAALAPILEEAGGTFTDWRGQPTIHAGEAVATNGRVLEEVLAITSAGD